jgi:serine/threonine protein kinase
MAPEQTGRMNRSIDTRGDLYSLGVTFYQMLTGTLSVAPGEGAIFLPHLSLVLRRAFLSGFSLAERSSPSRGPLRRAQ